MAYYDNAPGKKKKISHSEQGSWEEEGKNYHSRKNHKSSDTKEFSSKYRKQKNSDLTTVQKGNFTSSHQTKTIRENKKQNKKNYSHDLPGQNNGQHVKETEYYKDFEFHGKKEQISPENSTAENLLCGRNPIREALKGNRDIEKLLVQKGELSGSAREIVAMAKAKKIMVQEVEKNRLDEITLHHQGLIAYASAYNYATVEEILAEAEKRGEAPFIILLDGVTDPHNLGAIIRTAECTGAHGVIVPMHRSVGLTPAAVKASAGAIEHIPVARVTNLNRTIELLKKQGIWIYAVTMGANDYESVDFQGGTVLVIGAEGEGISRLTLEKCDMAVSLPIKGELDSLNASVAAGVMMYRVLSCRQKKKN